MPNVVLSNDDLTVLAPPDSIDVLVDIGPQGIRGNKTFVGIGNPNTLTSSGTIFSQTLILNDLYINTSPGEDYGYLYQYISQPGGDSWVQVLKMNPVIYSKNYTHNYVNGVAQITIPISDIVTVSGTPLTASNFSVKYSIAHNDPISSSMSIPSISGDDLVINFKAVEYNSGSWRNLGVGYPSNTIGVVTHLFISIVS